MRSNVDCAAITIDRLGRRLELLAESSSRRVAIVGQSRGGALARILALRRPELVSGIVTLGTPHLDPLAVHPLVMLQVRAVGVLGTLGFPGLMKQSCFDGECCARLREDFRADFPKAVGFCSVYSRRDGIVDWRTCLDPNAVNLEISSSHCGMSVHPDAYRVVARVLPTFSERRDAASRSQVLAFRGAA